MRLSVVICVCKHLAIIVFHCFDEGLGLSSVGNISRWIFRQRHRRGVEELPVLILKRVEKQYSALSARPVSFSAPTRMQSHAIGAMFRQDRLRYRYHSPQQTRAPDFCKAHDSSKRCRFEDGSGQPCTKSAEGKTDFCREHGGGKRCQFEDGSGQPCTKFAQGKTNFCIAHWGWQGGKRWQTVSKSAILSR